MCLSVQFCFWVQCSIITHKSCWKCCLPNVFSHWNLKHYNCVQVENFNKNFFFKKMFFEDINTHCWCFKILEANHSFHLLNTLNSAIMMAESVLTWNPFLYLDDVIKILTILLLVLQPVFLLICVSFCRNYVHKHQAFKTCQGT